MTQQMCSNDWLPPFQNFLKNKSSETSADCAAVESTGDEQSSVVLLQNFQRFQVNPDGKNRNVNRKLLGSGNTWDWLVKAVCQPRTEGKYGQWQPADFISPVMQKFVDGYVLYVIPNYFELQENCVFIPWLFPSNKTAHLNLLNKALVYSWILQNDRMSKKMQLRVQKGSNVIIIKWLKTYKNNINETRLHKWNQENTKYETTVSLASS